MLACFNVQKKKKNSTTVYYCRSSIPCLSQMLHFLQSPSFRQVQSALIGQLTQCIVIGRTPRRKCNSFSIIASFSFQNLRKTVNNVLSFTISSRGIESRDRHSNEACMYLHNQAAVVWPCLPLTHVSTHTRCCSCDSHARTHAHNTQNSAFEQSIANT